MTLQELGHIDELIAWLDNERDGADDAGFVAQSATNWHPALAALRALVARVEQAEAEVERLEFCRTKEHEAFLIVSGDLAALREQRCETCQKWDECGEDGQGECEFFGVHVRADFGCKAWARREP